MSGIVAAELFYGENGAAHNTRSKGAPLGTPMYSWGNQAGLADRPRPQLSSAASSVSAGQPSNVVTEAVIHSGLQTGAGSGHLTGSATPVDIKPPSVGGDSVWNVHTPGGGTRGRTEERAPRPMGGHISPNSGKKKIFIKDEGGNIRHVSRSEMITYNNKKKSYVPRPSSRERTDFSKFKTPGMVPPRFCPRCFRYVPPGGGGQGGLKRCSPAKCLRYGSSPLTQTQCECRGGFHRKEICGRAGRDPRKGQGGGTGEKEKN